MVTAPVMMKQALELKLPSAKTSNEAAPSTLGVAITKNGQLLLNGVLGSTEDLKDQASKAKKNDPNVQVLISADLDSRHEAVVRVIDTVRQAGISNFAFQVERQGQ